LVFLFLFLKQVLSTISDWKTYDNEVDDVLSGKVFNWDIENVTQLYNKDNVSRYVAAHFAGDNAAKKQFANVVDVKVKGEADNSESNDSTNKDKAEVTIGRRGRRPGLRMGKTVQKQAIEVESEVCCISFSLYLGNIATDCGHGGS
jgi:hypothetical protein